MIIIHSMNTHDSLPRAAADLVRQSMKTSPAGVVTGARQTGKSTLAQQVGTGMVYVSLDDIENLDRAARQPDALHNCPPLRGDEVQRSPDLLLAIKRAVDAKRTPGRFLLTGSANLLLMQRVSESL